MLREWGLTIDAWEALPWWQQQAYLTARNRHVEREDARQDAAAREQPRGKVAGRKNTRRPPSSGRSPSGGKTKLKDSPLWATRGNAPTVLPRPTPTSPPG